MPTLNDAYRLSNLRRAWTRLLTNADAAFKAYFRGLYSNFGVADQHLLTDLSQRLKRNTFQPEHACKLFLPKASGLLRPYSLIGVEDQIVYQAMANVVADALHPRVRHRYRRQVFGHLYAGPTSDWFYQRWQSGYAAFNKAARTAFDDGFRFSASFDLTAFYDSLDHGVLRHFLKDLRLDQEFIDKLIELLSHWTATDTRIYHGHGIPQGPLPSGLIAEVVMRYFDENHRVPKNVHYLRYVDDIRLFAKTPDELRLAITSLDRRSKDVGLFPQSGKIDIHEVLDIESELKTVSRPFVEDELIDEDTKTIDQDELRRTLRRMSARGRVKQTTEFKYLLSKATPTAMLNDRLWQVLENQPDLFPSLLRYFQRYKILPRKAGDKLLTILESQPIYASLQAELLRTAIGRLLPAHCRRLDRFVTQQWRPRKSIPADLAAELGRWGIRRGLFSPDQIKTAIEKQEWWTRANLLSILDEHTIGSSFLDNLLLQAIGDNNPDVALASAAHLVRRGGSVDPKKTPLNPVAARLLEAFNAVTRPGPTICGVTLGFSRILGHKPPPINWKKLFRGDYRQAESHLTWSASYVRTDVTAWVNAMDVFNDLLLTSLAKHDSRIKHQQGNFGTFLNTPKVKTSHPHLWAWVIDVHDVRGKSALSHSRKRVGKVLKQRTGPIRFKYIKPARTLLRLCLLELAKQFPK